MSEHELPLPPPAEPQGGSGRTTTGHEEDAVSRKGIYIFLIAFVGTVLACVVILVWMFDIFLARAEEQQPPPNPLAGERQPPPKPRLQTSSDADLKTLRAAEEKRLTSAGWISEREGIVHIPIDQAIKIVAEKGVPNWPPAKAEGDTPKKPSEPAKEAPATEAPNTEKKDEAPQ